MSNSNIPETFIVTITTQDGAFSIDMSLPSWIPASELSPQTLAILKLLDERFGSWLNCSLYHKGHQISGDQTLASVGAYDGSVIAVVI